MSIVTDTSGNRVVFCEGDSGSPDIFLWTRILIKSKHEDATFRVMIEPLGGKQGAKSFARGYTEARMTSSVVSGNQTDSWRVIRDRDLDEESSDGDLIIWDKGKTFLTGCTCIESYFTSPDMMERYIKENPPEYPDHPTDHEESLERTLREIRDYQAVRWALQRLRRDIQDRAEEKKLFRTAGLFDLPNKLAKKDGKFPTSLDLDDCRTGAINVCNAFRDVFKLVDDRQLNEYIDTYYNLFSGDDFWKSGFRYWFHGKDVLKKWLSLYQISSKKYTRWAASNLDWQAYPDLVEIQRKCQT